MRLNGKKCEETVKTVVRVYLSANAGKVMSAKVCDLNFECHCKQICSKKFNADQNKKIFD